ncbi:MAG: GNAT family N-acetyltransferase [Candidatus Bathyarchaeota archaeon]|nr:GNAT family N-acetyltransferase [Candidatus Bathyarchaeota archaeon]
MNATIRKARASDRNELLRMRLRMQEHMEASNPRIWRITEEGRRQIWPEVEETLNDEEDRVLVIEEEGIIMGFAHGRVVSRETYTPRTVGHIDTIYVEPAQRRQGIGNGLVRELCEYFRERGVDEVNLRYVLGNEEAEEFWRTLGLTPVIQTANTPLEALEERLKRAMKSPAGNRNKQGAP